MGSVQLRLWSVCLSVFLACVCQTARGTIVNGGNGGSYNTTTPTVDFPYWDNIGQWHNSSGSLVGGCFYLGNSWVLVANHQWQLDGGAAATVELDGASYDIIEGSDVRITNGDGSGADLRKFRIDGSPSLAGITTDNIITSTPAIDAEGYRTGLGRDREDTETFFHGLGFGYYWTSNRYKRWGTNDVTSTGIDTDTYGTTSYFATTWDRNAGDNECQATSGDSGGTVFVNDAGTWKLAGVMFGAEFYYDSGADKYLSVYGTDTYVADLSVYRGQIPEPATAGPLALGLLGLMLRRRRRHR